MTSPADNLPPDDVLERAKVHEVTGIFRTRKALDAAVADLLLAGFDRADIDLMASDEAVREKLGKVYIATEELPDVPGLPRQTYVAREDVHSALAVVAGTLSAVGAIGTVLAVVASGGALAVALAAAAGAGGWAALHIGRERTKELESQIAAGGLVLWVRVRLPEREVKAEQILRSHGAEAVRVHEVEIEKRLEDIPFARPET
jgi:hypothetical protein